MGLSTSQIGRGCEPRRFTEVEGYPPPSRQAGLSADHELFERSAVLEAAMGQLGGNLPAYDAAGVTYQLPDDLDIPSVAGPSTKEKQGSVECYRASARR